MINSRLRELDERWQRRASLHDGSGLDRVLPRLTASANHSRLWLVVGTGLALAGPTYRRAALRGMVSLGLASALANGPAKLLVRRARPAPLELPLSRRLRRAPITSSFPSGHSASAAAFATGVALESPLAAAPVAVLAAGVAYGRVHTGVHYPGDVLAGVLLGAGAAAALTRVWPRHPDRPVRAVPASAEAPALPEGEGLTVVLNGAAGSGSGVDGLADLLRRELPRAQVVHCEDDLEECLRTAARGARVLGVAGGDGTVNCAAGVALETALPLAVLPAGTLDHFARELGLASAEDTVAAVRAGTAVRVCVGSAGDGRPFLNTFSLGVYPRLVQERERREASLGKWPALLVALVRVLPGAEPVRLRVDGQDRSLWTLFAGNGAYRPAGCAPTWRPRLDEGVLDLRLLTAEGRASRLRLLLAVLTGQLGRSSLYQERVVDAVALDGVSGPLARDGEVGESPPSLRLAATDSLVVYRRAPG